MSYDWTGNADKKGGGSAPKIPAGAGVDLKIVKVVFGSKASGKFESKNGDPQIMIIFADSVDREAGEMVTLSEKAAWKLAQILAAAGANLERMKAAGITPDKFADEQFAIANLVGRKLKGDVEWDDQGKHATITPLRAEAGSQPATKETKKEEDPIPF